MRGLKGAVLMGLVAVAAAIAVAARPPVTIPASGAPAWYVRQPTWEETMRVSREALVKAEADAETKALAAKAADPALKDFQAVSLELAVGQAPQKVRVRVAGMKQMCVGMGSMRGGAQAVFGDPVLIDKAGKATRWRISSPRPTQVIGDGKATEIRQPYEAGGKPVVNGVQFTNNEAVVDLAGQYEWLEGWAAAVPDPKSKDKNAKAWFRIEWRSQFALRNMRDDNRTLVWRLVQRDFGDATVVADPHNIWKSDWTPGDFAGLAGRYARNCVGTLRDEAGKLAKDAKTPADLDRVRQVYIASNRIQAALQRFAEVNLDAARLAVEDLGRTFPGRYDTAKQMKAVEEFAARRDALRKALEEGKVADLPAAETLVAGVRGALLANPLLDFDKMLILRRNFGPVAREVIGGRLGMPQLNSHTHDTIPHRGWDNEIDILSDLRGKVRLTRLYKPAGGEILCDVDLHFGAERLMFSSIGANDRWQIFEMKADGSDVRQITPTDLPDVDFFDSCYLPNGDVAVTSNASYQGLPCEGGGRPMAQLYLLSEGGKKIRQLTFEQDSDWCPAVLNDGRLMYLRWEYTDTPHYFSRILFHMNPDGTEQMALYGTNSYFPNAFLYPRALPDHPTKIAGIAGGHHGISRSGRLLVIDPAKGHMEADGVVQEIPGRGKTVEPIIRDSLVNGVWPHFLQPYPLSEKYFLVAMKANQNALWGIYLVDIFDNLTLVKEVEGAALLEPVPLVKTPVPPVIPAKRIPGQTDATVYLADIYSGPGLVDIPRGRVKSLRVFSYHFAHNGTGGHDSVGVESSWDIKRVLGTVPVEADGSAYFRIPANLPVSIQPLDEKGRALQLMRSWLVGMPGETVSCVGCHEPSSSVARNESSQALARPVSDIKPWYGPPRPFAFEFEVQPVLDKFCVGCHDGKATADGRKKPDFTRQAKPGYRGFSASYLALSPFTRRPGPESDIHLFRPMEYHAATSELIQMLEKGHHGVRLDDEAWDRLITWIDLNVPYRGKWGPREWRGQDQNKRRLELARRFEGITSDPEAEYDAVAAAFEKRPAVTPILPPPAPKASAAVPAVPGWPFAAGDATARQVAGGTMTARSVEIGGLKIDLVPIPAGEFAMGEADGDPDARPVTRVRVDKPFWMAAREVTNAEFALFDPTHDSRFIDQQWKDHTTPGYPANLPTQPVIRVSWQQAVAFCQWLSRKTGETFTLPTEAEWEWACRAGAATPMWFGAREADFGAFANLSDMKMKEFAVTGINPQPVPNPPPEMAFIPKIEAVNDGHMITAPVGSYKPNPWGLYDMHGNVAEWMLTTFKPYPYNGADGRNSGDPAGRKVVRGGSWFDRPQRATAAWRLAYEPYQRVHNVGFRVVMRTDGKPKSLARGE